MAITDYIDFVNNYLTKNGMIGNAANINKAPDQLKLEIDELNQSISTLNDNSVKLTGNQTIAGVKTFSLSPIVPTPTTGTQVANKDYADLKVALESFTGTNQNLTQNGYQKLPGGLILQWGLSVSTDGNINVINFPITFPNGVLSVAGTGFLDPVAQYIGSVESVSNSQIRVRAGGYINASKAYTPTSIGTNPPVRWIAIGY